MFLRYCLEEEVAPYTGAWIETRPWWPDGLSRASHPIRVRGLKPGSKKAVELVLKSHPIRVRGLEQRLLLPPSGQYKVAPT